MKNFILAIGLVLIAKVGYTNPCGNKDNWDVNRTSHTETVDTVLATGVGVVISSTNVGDQIIGVVVTSASAPSVVSSSTLFIIYDADSGGVDNQVSSNVVTKINTFGIPAGTFIPVCKRVRVGIKYHKGTASVVDILIRTTNEGGTLQYP